MLVQHVQNVTFPLPLYRELGNPFMGLSMEAGVMEPSFEPSIEVIVPFREEIDLIFIDSSVSLRLYPLPLYIAVDGTVACTAGPSAAL